LSHRFKRPKVEPKEKSERDEYKDESDEDSIDEYALSFLY
jgi:hypothetical protein